MNFLGTHEVLCLKINTQHIGDISSGVRGGQQKKLESIALNLRGRWAHHLLVSEGEKDPKHASPKWQLLLLLFSLP